MSNNKSCPNIKERDLQEEGSTLKYVETENNQETEGDTNYIQINNKLNIETQLDNIEEQMNSALTFIKKEENSSNARTRYIVSTKKGEITNIKYDLLDELEKVKKENKENKDKMVERTNVKMGLQDKLFQINELIQEKKMNIERVDKDLKFNKKTNNSNSKKNKILIISNIVFFGIVILLLIFMNLSSFGKYKTKKALKKVKTTVVKPKTESLLNNRNNKKDLERLMNNENKVIQKKRMINNTLDSNKPLNNKV